MRWSFSSLDFDPPSRIVEVTIETTWGGWTDDFLSFGDDFVRVDFLNDITANPLPISSNSWVATLHTVPEPTAGLLVAAAMLTISGIGYR